MTDRNDGVWRDEERLPLSELNQAMATPSLDGQLDEPTDNDAGYEDEFGRAARVDEQSEPGDTDPQRVDRPSTTGRTGPH